MTKRLKELRDRKAALLGEAEELTAKADTEEFTEEDEARLEAILEKDDGLVARVNRAIEREERLQDERRSMEATQDANEDTEDEEAGRLPAQVRQETQRFETFGQQLQAVAHAGMNDVRGGGASAQERDPRLIWGAATGAGEAVPSDGGFLVQQDFSTQLLADMHELGDIVSRVRPFQLSGNSNGIKLPAIDEKSRVDGSRWGGVQAYWADEADTVTGSKPKFRSIDMTLNKLFGLGYATDELLQDAAVLESIMSQAFAEELTFKTEDGILNGTGSGQPLGINNSGAVIVIDKESGQAAQTIVTANILNMLSRLPIRSRRNAVWLINQDAEPQLWQLTLGSGTAVVLLYRPPGVEGPNANSPFGTLLGRPVIPVEYSATLGTAGDIMLADLSQYLLIDKGGPRSAQSMHVRFIHDEMTFRFIYRVDGQPAWKQPVTPKNGVNTQSPFITLATRS